MSDKDIFCIGALGGSGTRAVAQIFLDLGVYMGDDLNAANDNLIFTRLFKDPKWYDNSSKKEILKRLEVFENYMNDKIDLDDFGILFKSANQSLYSKNNYLFFIRSLIKVFGKKKLREKWGWKEPNSQVFLEDIYSYFENLKYIHVLRHGLDMAFSNNIQQLKNWGHLFDIHLNGNETQNEIARKQLDYWIMSTKYILKIKKNNEDNFFLMNHSKFCFKPNETITDLLNFAQLNPTKIKRELLNEIPKIPKSLGRYKDYDLGIFSEGQLNYVKQIGFNV